MSWAAQREQGSARVTRFALWVALRGGRALSAPLVWVATGWFLLVSRGARLASRDYLGRVLGRKPGLQDVARHFHSFGLAVLDRVQLLGAPADIFDIRTEGIYAVLAVLAQGRGCILLGAHLGSFEVLRRVAMEAPVPVWALMYRRNAGALTPLLDRLAPSLHQRVLEIGDTASMIRARECVDRGEIVGILADRAPEGIGSVHRMVTVPFLGGAAAFPSGPFVLASMLSAPVVLFHAVRTGKRRYQVTFEPFVDHVVLRRSSRAADLRNVVGKYAAALESACLAHPYQWFNFFPFWETPAGEAATDAEQDLAASRAAVRHDMVASGGG